MGSNSLVREMVCADDGMGIRLFDIELSEGDRLALSNLSDVRPYTIALFGLSGQVRIDTRGQALVLSKETLVAFEPNAACSVTASSSARIILILCEQGSFEGVLIRHLDELSETGRSVEWGNGLSQRFLVEKDGLGFALCYTIGNPNTDSHIQYKHHLEACYYISGSGEYTWEGGAHPISTGAGDATMFVMDKHDEHWMRIKDLSVCLSVFCPPISGHEKHDFSGSAPSVY